MEKKNLNLIQTKPLCASLSNLADMLTMVNPFHFGGRSSKVKVKMSIIDTCGVRGDATLCVVIFSDGNDNKLSPIAPVKTKRCLLLGT